MNTSLLSWLYLATKQLIAPNLHFWISPNFWLFRFFPPPSFFSVKVDSLIYNMVLTPQTFPSANITILTKNRTSKTEETTTKKKNKLQQAQMSSPLCTSSGLHHRFLLLFLILNNYAITKYKKNYRQLIQPKILYILKDSCLSSGETTWRQCI